MKKRELTLHSIATNIIRGKTGSRKRKEIIICIDKNNDMIGFSKNMYNANGKLTSRSSDFNDQSVLVTDRSKIAQWKITFVR